MLRLGFCLGFECKIFGVGFEAQALDLGLIIKPKALALVLGFGLGTQNLGVVSSGLVNITWCSTRYEFFLSRLVGTSAVRSTEHEYLSKSESFGQFFYLSKSKSSVEKFYLSKSKK